MLLMTMSYSLGKITVYSTIFSDFLPSNAEKLIPCVLLQNMW
jgi:hypothetical protein